MTSELYKGAGSPRAITRSSIRHTETSHGDLVSSSDGRDDAVCRGVCDKGAERGSSSDEMHSDGSKMKGKAETKKVIKLKLSWKATCAKRQ